jgi:MFS family permease
MANTLNAPGTILAPLLGGLLADAFGYPTTFIVSAVFGVLAFVTLIFFFKDPDRGSRRPGLNVPNFESNQKG